MFILLLGSVPGLSVSAECLHCTETTSEALSESDTCEEEGDIDDASD